MSDLSIALENVTLTIRGKMTFEDVVSQLQPFSKKILSVKNGEELLMYDTIEEIPKTISTEGKPVNNIFYYRCSETDDMYAFFSSLEPVKNNVVDKVVKIPSRGSINQDGKISMATNSTITAPITTRKIIY